MRNRDFSSRWPSEAPTFPRLGASIGVNLGDVLIDGENILGDGVNIAARLEGICELGVAAS